MEQINITWHIFSPNLISIYGSYMNDIGLKWKHLFLKFIYLALTQIIRISKIYYLSTSYSTN
jgi:hypothetical protein